MQIRKTVIAPIALLAGCASAPTSMVQVPDTLRPGPAEKLALVVPAKGDQIYECRAKKSEPGAYEWAFVAPEAELFDRSGKKIGRHYAGPHWEAADGSRIVGVLKQRADAPASGAIPWLLLGAQSVGPQGAFSRVTSIQRVSTVGGIAPAGGCAEAGRRARVPYVADYYFFSGQ
jgi:hypothetical protein